MNDMDFNRYQATTKRRKLNGARPSAGTMMTTQLYTFSFFNIYLSRGDFGRFVSGLDKVVA